MCVCVCVCVCGGGALCAKFTVLEGMHHEALEDN